MKHVTYPTECNCISHLGKFLNPLPPDIVCNCMGPVEMSPEEEIQTTSLASSKIKCKCDIVKSENEGVFVSARDIGESLIPPKTSMPYPQAQTTGFSACKCKFGSGKESVLSTCICGSECPLKQEIPTKETERISDVSACTCSIQSPLTKEMERVSDVSECTCSFESLPSESKQKGFAKETERTSDSSACSCSFESRLTDAKQTIPTKDLEKTSECKCSFESSRPTDTNGCMCNSECPFKSLNAENMNLASSYSHDLMYIDRIKAMIQKEKSLKQEIIELEHKEKAYTDKLKELNEVDGNTGPKRSLSIQNLYLESQKLEGDNKNLEDQIKDVNLEIKQVMENMEGPLKRELDRERRKCEQLENQIRDLASKQSSVESNGRKELEFVSRQVENAKRNINDIQLINKRLREEVCVLSCKCDEMQNELIEQKLGELNKLSAKKKRQRSSCICNSDTAIPNEELEAIAKNLSQLLREAKQCSTCKTENPDVIDTVKCIKDLVNVVKPNTNVSDKDRGCNCEDDKSSSMR